MKKMLLLVLTICSVSLFAEVKIGYIYSQKIMAEYSVSKKALEDLNNWGKEQEKALAKMETDIRKLEDEMKNMSPMISEDKKKKKLEEGQKKMQDYYAFKDKIWGQGQGLLAKREELLTPATKSIDKAIKEVSKKGNYDFILDANTGVLLDAKEEHDITNKVLQALK